MWVSQGASEESKKKKWGIVQSVRVCIHMRKYVQKGEVRNNYNVRRFSVREGNILRKLGDCILQFF